MPGSHRDPIRVEQVFTPVSVQRQVDDSDFVSRRYPFEQRAQTSAPGSASPALQYACIATASPRPLPASHV